MKLFLVGKILLEHVSAWEFIGICDTPTLSFAMCDDEKFFVAPVNLNEKAPSETVVFPEYFFPRVGDETSNPIPAWATNLNAGGLL